MLSFSGTASHGSLKPALSRAEAGEPADLVVVVGHGRMDAAAGLSREAQAEAGEGGLVLARAHLELKQVDRAGVSACYLLDALREQVLLARHEEVVGRRDEARV